MSRRRSRASITLSNPRTTNAYEWQENGESRVAKAGEGKQWDVVHARTENTADRTVRLSLTLNFKGVRGDTVFHPGRNKSLPEKYVGGKVPPRASRWRSSTSCTRSGGPRTSSARSGGPDAGGSRRSRFS